MPANSSVVKTRRYLIVGGYAALAVTFAVMGVVPYVVGTAKVRATIGKMQQEIDANLKKKAQLVDVDRSIELIKHQVADYPRLVPENQELGDFLASLSQKLEEAGMKDMDHKALASITLGRTQKLPIELRGGGTFGQFHDFLVKLEHLSRKCSVGKLVVESDSEMSGKVGVDLMLYIYNQKPG